MNRRNFLKTVPTVVAGLAIAPVAAHHLAQPAKGEASIMLAWSHPVTAGHGVATWDTPTQAEYDKACAECLLLHLRFASDGYDVAYREFDVLRFREFPGFNQPVRIRYFADPRPINTPP